MIAVPSLIAKDGAEGVTVAATAEGFAVAVKIEDGSRRAVMPVLVTALRAIGGVDAVGAGVDAARLDELGAPKAFGGGAVVGRPRVVFGARE